jgi:hypothetical protein
MYLQDGTRTHFMNFIAREFPHLVPRYERLYTKKYPPDAYRKEIKAMVSLLQDRYGMSGRRFRDEEEEVGEKATIEPEQGELRWR